MLLTAEIKDDNYQELPRQAETQYAPPSQTYLKADASTGRNYVDLNAAAKTYDGAWLFGREHVEMNVSGMRAEWQQWCPVPAGIADGVLLRGNVIYQNNDGSYRMSSDQFEGILRTEGGQRYFDGKTQHTFHSNNLPGGSMRVVANLHIALTQQLAYNPMIVLPHRQEQYQSQQAAQYSNPSAQYWQPQYQPAQYQQQQQYPQQQYSQQQYPSQPSYPPQQQVMAEPAYQSNAQDPDPGF